MSHGCTTAVRDLKQMVAKLEAEARVERQVATTAEASGYRAEYVAQRRDNATLIDAAVRLLRGAVTTLEQTK